MTKSPQSQMPTSVACLISPAMLHPPPPPPPFFRPPGSLSLSLSLSLNVCVCMYDSRPLSPSPPLAVSLLPLPSAVLNCTPPLLHRIHVRIPMSQPSLLRP